eukprot:CAMPEP_0114557084 /NCGR_PEP_ID=MMETSP0114-20121206/9634_1 /TAXON_ID=31324 /ORGANISM="Goniomonas sp, Strain m" /LENGTH=224 /DNA_ID=CAMNT_0001742333 /DNA_START=26 /DNA_END=700 /DNA_ORIENTATION=-
MGKNLRRLQAYLLNREVRRWRESRGMVHRAGNLPTTSGSYEWADMEKHLASLFYDAVNRNPDKECLEDTNGELVAAFKALGVETTLEDIDGLHKQLTQITGHLNPSELSSLVVTTTKSLRGSQGHKALAKDGELPFSLLQLSLMRRYLVGLTLTDASARARIQISRPEDLPRPPRDRRKGAKDRKPNPQARRPRSGLALVGQSELELPVRPATSAGMSVSLSLG